MPESSNFPRRLLSLVKKRSPSKTWIKTVGWLSAAVEKLVRMSIQFVHKNERETIHLTFRCGDDGVTRNQLGENTAGSLDTEGKRADIHEKNTTSSFGARKDSTLNSSTISDGFIRVDSLGRFLATEEFLEELLNFGDTS